MNMLNKLTHLIKNIKTLDEDSIDNKKWNNINKAFSYFLL